MNALDRLRARLAEGFVSFVSTSPQVSQESQSRGGFVSAARAGPENLFDRSILSPRAVPLASLGFCTHLGDGTDKTDKTSLLECGELAAAPPWSDLDAWCAKLGAAGPLDDRRIVLREWVDAAGGWHDAAAVSLPVTLPNGLALATLKAHARALRLEVHEDSDDPALMRWLRGAPIDMEASQ